MKIDQRVKIPRKYGKFVCGCCPDCCESAYSVGYAVAKQKFNKKEVDKS